MLYSNQEIEGQIFVPRSGTSCMLYSFILWHKGLYLLLEWSNTLLNVGAGGGGISCRSREATKARSLLDNLGGVGGMSWLCSFAASSAISASRPSRRCACHAFSSASDPGEAGAVYSAPPPLGRSGEPRAPHQHRPTTEGRGTGRFRADFDPNMRPECLVLVSFTDRATLWHPLGAPRSAKYAFRARQSCLKFCKKRPAGSR